MARLLYRGNVRSKLAEHATDVIDQLIARRTPTQSTHTVNTGYNSALSRMTAAAAAAILEEARQFVAASRTALAGTAVQIVSSGDPGDDGGGEGKGTAQLLAGLLDRYDAYCFDCDGVLWRGAELLPGAAATLELLRYANANVCKWLSVCVTGSDG